MTDRMRQLMILSFSVVLPFSGYVILKRPFRGFLMFCWSFVFMFVTYNLTTPAHSMIGRLSGGIGIFILSLVEIHRLTTSKLKHY